MQHFFEITLAKGRGFNIPITGYPSVLHQPTVKQTAADRDHGHKKPGG